MADFFLFAAITAFLFYYWCKFCPSKSIVNTKDLPLLDWIKQDQINSVVLEFWNFKDINYDDTMILYDRDIPGSWVKVKIMKIDLYEKFSDIAEKKNICKNCGKLDEYEKLFGDRPVLVLDFKVLEKKSVTLGGLSHSFC